MYHREETGWLTVQAWVCTVHAWVWSREREGGREGICIQVTLHVNHAREINYGGADDGSK